MSHIYLLPVTFNSGKSERIIYPVLLKDENELILIDCGYPDSMPKLENAMQKYGLSLSQLTKIIITHHDHDHMGALKDITQEYPQIEVLCSKEQAPYITGKRKSLRLQQAEDIQNTLPEDKKEYGIQFQKVISSVKKVDEVSIIDSGEILPYCGGIEVVDTKGHMPGHISLYVKQEKTLISGDALVNEGGKLRMAVPEYALNMEEAKDSIRNLENYDIEKIICYHGGVCDTSVKDCLEEIIASFS
ncbi:MBL fold metallo-hydrolase [Lacrimispora sp.]|uniref:MBL fold metallo-hydrolase n=1 Tax=Lacrimispora sp. TaxID=2719234 RepID=UPI0028B24AFB|nr:MBL fold metallo-hydrolase [Lacrimispora sp.]